LTLRDNHSDKGLAPGNQCRNHLHRRDTRLSSRLSRYRRACTLIGVGRSALRYRSVKAQRDVPLLQRMASLSAPCPRYGYRRIAIFLGRDGHRMSFGRTHRLWRKARLPVPRRWPCKRIATGRPRPKVPSGANQVWSYDFVFDWCVSGQQLKCLTITDEWTKEGLAIEVDGRIRSARVIEMLSRLVLERDAPAYLRSDNGHAKRRCPATLASSAAPLPNMLRDRADFARGAGMDEPDGSRVALHRAQQADAERLRRELQRPVPRRMPERGGVTSLAEARADIRTLAAGLQPGAAELGPRRHHTRGRAHPVRGRPAAQSRPAPPLPRYHPGGRERTISNPGPHYR